MSWKSKLNCPDIRDLAHPKERIDPTMPARLSTRLNIAMTSSDDWVWSTKRGVVAYKLADFAMRSLVDNYGHSEHSPWAPDTKRELKPVA